MRHFLTAKKTSGLALSALAAAILVGCDTNNTTIKNPNPETLTPTGNITGILTDASTGEPVVGARIYIPGVSSTTTDRAGHFALRKVPANTYVDGALIAASYAAVIDTSRVTSPANANYAPFDTTCNGLNAVFSSLNESAGGGGGETNSSNHDTPIEGLTPSYELTIGKRSGTISGTVFDTDGSPIEGVTVDVTVGDTVGSTTCAGTTPFLIASTTTDANGDYTLTDIEEGTTPTVRAYTNDNSKSVTETFAQITATDKIRHGDNDGDLVLQYNDNIGPILIATSIEPGADFAIANDTGPFDTTGNLVATFTWNESIADSEYSNNITADSTSASANSIYNDVNVTFNGAKAGNIAHTLNWNADKTVLTVTVPSTAIIETSSYTISIATARTSGRLQDAAGNAATLGANVSTDNITFTTSGGVTTAAPAIAVSTTNIDWDTFPIDLDWLPVNGASSYNVYRTTTIGSSAMAPVFIGNVTTSAFTDSDQTSDADNGGATGDANDGSGAENVAGMDFIVGESSVSHSYVVAAVNSNLTEGAASNAVAASDAVSPRLTSIAGNAITDNNGNTTCETANITFNEPIAEAAAETATNYSYQLSATAGDTIVATSAVQTSATTVTVTFPETACTDFTDDTNDSELFIVGAGVTDYTSNGMDGNFNTWHQDSFTID